MLLVRPKSSNPVWHAILQAIKARTEVNPKDLPAKGVLPLTQDHYHIAGSMEATVSKITSEFTKWCRADENLCYRYSQILGTDSECLIVCCYNWDDAGTAYYVIPYTMNNNDGSCTFGEPEPCDVSLVVVELGSDDGDDEQTTNEETKVGEKKTKEEQAEPINAGLGITTENIVKPDAPVAAGTAPIPAPAESEDEEAEASGPSVPDTVKASVGPGGGYQGDEGAGPVGDDHSEDIEAGEGAGSSTPAETGAGTRQTLEPDTSLPLQQSSLDKAGDSLSYITQAKKSEDGKTLHLEGIATRANIINSEGVVYPKKVWEQNLVPLNVAAKGGKLVGKLEHPKSGESQGLRNSAIKFDKLWMEDSDVHFQARVIATQDGQELAALIDSGIQVDLSSRGYGSAKSGTFRGQSVKLIQDDFVCVGFDAVLHGASTGSGVTSAEYQSAGGEGNQMKEETQVQTLTPVEAEVQRAQTMSAFNGMKTEILQTEGLSEIGRQTLDNAITELTQGDLTGLAGIKLNLLPNIKAFMPTVQAEQTQSTTMIGGVTQAPTFFIKRSEADKAPKNIPELIDQLCADLPDTYPQGQGIDASPHQSHFNSPREACKRLMYNICNERQGSFNGLQAARGLLALEQGRLEQAEDILLQALPTGGTVASANVAGDGAPLSAPLIFPLIRRVFPHYIMNEICSIQPMDRPQGKIFFLDQYRTSDPSPGTDKRIDLNTSSSPFNSSYADNATEGAAAEIVRLRLTSITIDAYTKKLGAAWSIEEMQDLRAYHGLDAAQELLGGVAREMALEWNKTVLDDMVTQGTAGALTFGTGIPGSGFTQQADWDSYLWNYVQKLDNLIFSKRNGPMTHLIVGMDAALALAKSARAVFSIGDDSTGDMGEAYPGTTFYGRITTPNGSRLKVFKTNFWGIGTTNGSIMMGLRRGPDWSDTPYIWAPYTDYVTPMLTDPSDFTQKQGIMSRAAKKVVVSDAIGTITIASSTGALL